MDGICRVKLTKWEILFFRAKFAKWDMGALWYMISLNGT